MKKIYITGIAGMLGANLAYELRNNYIIGGVDKFQLNAPNINSEQYDLLNTQLLDKHITCFKPDCIIHTAAAVDVDKCEMNENYAHRLNTLVTKSIAEIGQRTHTKIIYISTDAVFSGTEEKFYAETDDTNPVNIYGKTKLDGEKYILLNKNNLVLRTNIYGFNLQDKYSFGEWILYHLINGEELRMFTDIDFSPILVNDLAKIIDIAISFDLSGLFHACGTGLITKYDFGCLLKQIFGIDIGKIIKETSNNYPFQAPRAKHMGMSNKKISDELKIKIASPVESLYTFFKMYKEDYPVQLKEWGNIKY